MNSEWYPEDWPIIAALVKESNDYICQGCGVECRRDPSDATKPVLTVAHYDHEYEGDAVFLVAYCVRCHLIHDAPFGWQARRRHERVRRRQAGQLEFLLEGRAR